ncbi:hypothetical protein [Xanthomonas vesicatoria]|nr:hypothetical protein [Xanthomonas vesicatoria]MCC8619488.1 MFS transporter [Xanthomonas vesicatoria]MCC8622603.1 MFS transporter [Xanthomonas vesicatoria]MCC8633138.1 MFS transporter [Xanthomonas vesicatoria]MCC8694254.1 MFS transporter [Xanthomonas vesicatoria]MCC8703075.1 MFS transporter [Xanthomonas vesicatoria]
MPPRTALSMETLLAYTAAHVGKSLLWYTGELLLIFALTEYVGLGATAAGVSVAAGLLVSAAMGLFTARRWHAGVSLAWAGRAQWRGIAMAAVTMSLLFLVPLLPPPVRLPCVLLLSLPFRAAYAISDVAQNTLLGLSCWPWRGAQGVSALRLIGSGLAALSMSAAIGLLLSRPHAGAATAMAVVCSASCIAVSSSWWLRQTLQSQTHDIKSVPAHRSGAPSRHHQLLPLVVIAMLSLTLPTFTKLAPYLAQTLVVSRRWGSAVLISYAIGSVIVQPLAARLHTGAFRRLGYSGAVLAGCGLLFAMQTTRGIWLDAALALCVGMAAGSAGQWVWARHCELSTQYGPAQQAHRFATLTALAQVALALGSAAIGILLRLYNDHGAAQAQLAWSMAIGPVVCGAACVLLAWSSRMSLERRLPAETAPTSTPLKTWLRPWG